MSSRNRFTGWKLGLATLAAFALLGSARAQMYPGNGMGTMATPPTSQRPPMLKAVGVEQRLGLVEASENKIGNLVDAVLLYCYHYDPATGKYGAIIMNIMRLAGVVTMLVLGSFMYVMFRRPQGHPLGAERVR